RAFLLAKSPWENYSPFGSISTDGHPLKERTMFGTPRNLGRGARVPRRRRSPARAARPGRTSLRVEELEPRATPAITASIDAGGVLQVQGDNLGNTVILDNASGTTYVTGVEGISWSAASVRWRNGLSPSATVFTFS